MRLNMVGFVTLSLIMTLSFKTLHTIYLFMFYTEVKTGFHHFPSSFFL